MSLLRKLDVVVDLALGRTGDATHLVAHALKVEVDVDDRLEQTEVGCNRALGGDQVVAHGLEVGAAGVDLEGLVLSATGELAVVIHKSSFTKASTASWRVRSMASKMDSISWRASMSWLEKSLRICASLTDTRAGGAYGAPPVSTH